MEKRVHFKGWFLPALLIAPQLFITAVFFFYPAGTAIWWSLFNPDPFGLSTKFVGLANFEFLFSDVRAHLEVMILSGGRGLLLPCFPCEKTAKAGDGESPAVDQ